MRWLLSGIGVLIGLALLELGLRLALPPPDGTPLWADFRHSVVNRTAPRGSYLFEADRGWALRPGLGYEIGGRRHDIDEQGYRINDNAALDLASQATLLAIGDSFTFGHRLDNRDTWPSALERRLRLRVVNAGVSGYGLDQMLVQAEKTLGLFPATSTVFIALISDDLDRLRHSVRAGVAKPHYRFDGRGELERVPANHAEARTDEPGGPFKQSLGHSYLAHRILSIVFPSWWNRGTWNHYEKTGIDVVRVGRGIVDALAREIAADRGLDLVFLLLPGSPMDFAMIEPGEKNPAPHAIASHMAAVASRTPNVFVVDLQSELARRFPTEMQRQGLYHEKSVDPAGHFNARGADLIASVVASFVDEKGTVVADATSRYRFP